MTPLAIAIAVLAPGLAGANDQPPPPPYAPALAPAGGAPGDAPPAYAPSPYGPPIHAPEEITDFDDSAPVPYGYTKVSRVRKGPIIGGAVTLGATYLVTVVGAAVASLVNKANASNADVTPLFIPVAGPFLEIGQTDNSAAKFFATLSGLGQTTGAILLAYGLTSSRTVLVRNDQLMVTSIAPLVAPGASGLSVVGRF